MSDQSWLKVACKIASTSTCRKKHGAVLVKGGRVLAVGVNSSRNNPCNVVDPKTEASYHAEFATIAGMSLSDSTGATLYVARVNNQNIVRDSKPCKNCIELISSYDIKKVVYTCSESIDECTLEYTLSYTSVDYISYGVIR